MIDLTKLSQHELRLIQMILESEQIRIVARLNSDESLEEMQENALRDRVYHLNRILEAWII